MSTGERFEVGQVWATPRGTLWRVMQEISGPTKRHTPQVVLREGIDGTGRKALRDWDAVLGWVIHQHKDGTLAGPGVYR